jgi:hypothetical protein
LSKYGTSGRTKANNWTLRYVWLFLVYRNKGRYLDKMEILTKGNKKEGKREGRCRGYVAWDGMGTCTRIVDL